MNTMGFALIGFSAVVILIVAVAILWAINISKKFVLGHYKTFIKWVIITATLALFHVIASTVIHYINAVGVAEEIDLILDLVRSGIAILTGIAFLKAGLILNEMSKEYGFASKEGIK